MLLATCQHSCGRVLWRRQGHWHNGRKVARICEPGVYFHAGWPQRVPGVLYDDGARRGLLSKPTPMKKKKILDKLVVKKLWYCEKIQYFLLYLLKIKKQK